MKGFYIFEESLNQLRKEATIACFKLGDIAHIFNTKLEPNAMISAEVEITASVGNTITKATCNKDDTYDFETGALIALMKMCGVDKVVRACNEAFSEDTFKTYATMYERELNSLKKDFDKVKDLKDFYKKNYEDVKEHYGKLGERNKYLIEENKKLKSDKDLSWKNYQRNIQKKQDRINELERAYKASNDDEAKLVEYYQREIKNLKGNIDELFESDKYSKSLVGKLSFEKHRLEEENEKLQHEYNLCLNSENALKYTVDSLNKSVDKLNKAIYGYKNDLYNTAKRCNELEKENEKLKLDCEMLQHGYIVTDNVPSGYWDGDVLDMVFLPGRACGKQYKALVDLFKKTDQKKVDAAYKEAYNTTLPVWQKEALRQAYEIRKIEASKYIIPHVHEWLYKIPTKRDEMWEKIFALHKKNDVIIEVKKEDVNTFLHEIEDKFPEITWKSGAKIFESKGTIKDIYEEELELCDTIYFRLSKENTLSYSNDSHIYPYRDLVQITYLPPMRWDLFEKGRIVIKVEKESYGEFCSRMLSHFDKVGVNAFNHACKFGYFAFNKDTRYVERILSSDNGDAKEINRRKVVDWEDVR